MSRVTADGRQDAHVAGIVGIRTTPCRPLRLCERTARACRVTDLIVGEPGDQHGESRALIGVHGLCDRGCSLHVSCAVSRYQELGPENCPESIAGRPGQKWLRSSAELIIQSET